MSKYDYGKELIDRTLQKKKIINSGGVVSLDSLNQTMNRRFEGFRDAFYSINTQDTITNAYKTANGKSIDNGFVYPVFLDDTYSLYFGYNDGGRPSVYLYQFFQEKDCNDFYYIESRDYRYDTNLFYQAILPIIPNLFEVMRAYDKYGKYLTWTGKKYGYKFSPTDTYTEYEVDKFKINLDFERDAKCSYRIDFSDIDIYYQTAKWSDGRVPLYDLLRNNKEQLAERIPLDVKSLKEPDLFQQVYLESLNFDQPGMQKIRK